MKRLSVSLVVAALLGGVLFSSLAYAKQEAKADALKASAKAFVGMLAQEDFSNAVRNFGSPLKTSLPAEKVRETWKSVLAEHGSFKKIRDVQLGKVEEYGGKKYDVVLVRCEFAQADYTVRVSYNSEKQITSLWFVPTDK